MKKLITLIAILCFGVSANANVTHNLNKSYFKNSKVKPNKSKKIVKKSPTVRNNYCDTHAYGGGGIAYVCFSDLPCLPSYTVTCYSMPGGGSMTLSVVYP